MKSDRDFIGCNQNSNLKANCITRGLPVVALIPPKAELETLPEGLAKFTMLKMLKNSARNSPFSRSAIGMCLFTEKSTLRWNGPRKIPRPALPKRLPALVKSAVLKYWVKRLSTEPDNVAVSTVAPGAQFARLPAVPKYVAPALSLMVMGVPDCPITMPASSHPEKTRLPIAVSFQPNPQRGTS